MTETGVDTEALTGGMPVQQQTAPGVTSEMTPEPDHGESSYRGCERMVGRKALVTGGDSGIGRAVCLAFAREGADVAFTYMPGEEEDAEQTALLIAQSGRAAVPIQADLRSAEACDAVVSEAVGQLGGMDVLVNNAGFQVGRDEGFEDISNERLDRVFKTNLYALFWMIRAALPHLPRGGCIVNNSSIQAFVPSVPLVDYAATKAAINNATVNMAAEFGPRGIRVNAVAPGPIWTPLQPATQPPEKMENFGQNTPLGRGGQPAEVAPAFVFLANERDASYVSGTVLGVTGGDPVF